MLGREACIEDDAGGVDDRPRVERGADAAFAVVAHQQATELQSTAFQCAGFGIPLAHLAIGVLEVAALRACAEVAPPADHAVAQESSVGLVGPALKAHIRNFTSHLAMGANDGGAGNAGPHAYRGPFADDQRPLEMGTRFNSGPRANHHSSGFGINTRRSNPGIRGGKDLICRAVYSSVRSCRQGAQGP